MDACVDELLRCPVKEKQARMAMLSNIMREVHVLKTSFTSELRLTGGDANNDAHRAFLKRCDERIYDASRQLGAQAMIARVHTSNDTMLKETGELQRKTDDSLRRTLAKATETRDLGRDIEESLGDQRDQIVRIERTVKDIHEEISLSNYIMGVIFRRMATDRVVVGCVVLLIACAVGAIAVVVSIPK